MAIPDPWSDPQETSDSNENATNRARESERDHAGAGGYSDDAAESTGDNLVQFPGTSNEVAVRDEPGVLARLGAASKVWLAEVRETGTGALDGSVWRSRPPSLRDIHTRAQRAEWAGGIEPLRVVGQAFGFVSLLLTAAGYALLWVARRPARLLLTTAIAVVIVVLAV